MVAGAELLDFDFFLLLLSAGRARLVLLSFESVSGVLLWSIFFLFFSFSGLFVSSSLLVITTCMSGRLAVLLFSLIALNVSFNFLFVVLVCSVVFVFSSLVIVVVVV